VNFDALDHYLGYHGLVFSDMSQVSAASMVRAVEECQPTRRRIIAERNLRRHYHSENVKYCRGRDVRFKELSEFSNAYYTTSCSKTRANEN
jgi:hypothetical protein